jgi:hypothetical protein
VNPTVIIGSLLASLLVPAGASAPAPAPPPPPGTVLIEVVKVNGTGCRPRTASAAVSPDNTAFTVAYSTYTAQVGVGARPADYRKDCRLRLKLDVPRGVTYAVGQADYRGFAQLERGATGLETANYHFQGSAETPPVTHSFTGPFDDDWHTTDRPDDGDLVYAPCGRTRHLDIYTELRVNAGTSDTTTKTSFMSMDSADGSIVTRYQFVWKKCT